MDFKKIFRFVLVLLLSCGFQLISHGNAWNISSSSTTNSKLFVVYSSPTQTLTNDLASSDVLAGTTTVTVQQAMNSIFNDYNNITGSFVTLVDSSDSDFAARATNRTITIETGTVNGATSGGEARPNWNGSNIVDCKIVLIPQSYDSAKRFISTVTHEIGHCLGLAHPMDTVNSIMSYYRDRDLARLQMDDKMGLVYLYPTDPDKSKEEATLGLACSRN